MLKFFFLKMYLASLLKYEMNMLGRTVGSSGLIFSSAMLVILSCEAALSAGAKLKFLTMDSIALYPSTHLVLLAVGLDWCMLAQLPEIKQSEHQSEHHLFTLCNLDCKQ